MYIVNDFDEFNIVENAVVFDINQGDKERNGSVSNDLTFNKQI